VSVKSALAEDPVERYQRLVALTTPTPPELTADGLEPVIQAAGGQPAAEVAALSRHVAEHSGLTAAQARPLVSAAIGGQAAPRAKAEAVSGALASAAGLSANIQLSDPVMLAPWARFVFAGVLFTVAGGCVGCITALSEQSATQGSALIGLAVIGVLALIGILVLVMGYKNVTIKGGPSTGGSS
jgi:hypothetical protein